MSQQESSLSSNNEENKEISSSSLSSLSSEQDNVYEKAAQLICNAQFLLITCGAGFSKDSGLAVYRDIATHPIYQQKNLTYHDLARPVTTMSEHEELLDYYGFWMNCAQTYMNTPSHSGYQILKDWKDLIFSKKLLPNGFTKKQVEILSGSEWWLQHNNSNINLVNQSHTIDEPSNVASNMFVYSSNVDNHFSRYFDGNEIYNLHGHALKWQCGKNCDETSVWDFTSQLNNYPVNQETMQISSEKLNELKCEKCNAPSMPNVLMFGDLGQYIRNIQEEDRYIAWECAVETFSKDFQNFPFVIIELGCGLTVPSVRCENECVLLDCDQSYLIRINLGQEELDTIHNQELIPLKDERILNIKNGCKDALHLIHEQVLKILNKTSH